MKTFVGRSFRLGLYLCLLLWGALAHAELTSSVDRKTISMGETIRLTLSGDGGDRVDQIDLSALQFDWEILSSGSSTNTSFINGQRNTTRSIELDLMPLRDGVLSIPAFSAGGKRTTPIAITVQPQTVADAGDNSVRFSTEISKSDVYIQEQLILTVTVEQAINLDGAEVTPINIDGAIVEELSRRNFQRQINGRLWRVTQLRYAVYPQQRGLMKIPELALTAREVLPGRSLLGARLGKRFVLTVDAKTVEVKPVPAAFPGDVWLPAASLELTQSWSTAPETMAIGDSSTRTLTLTAAGLLSSQLPSLTSMSSAAGTTGIRIYPDQESSDQIEQNEGFVSTRTRSEAIVASTGGTWTLPEVSVPWWNTQTDTLEYARLPSTTISIDSPQVNVPVTEMADIPSSTSAANPGGLLLWLVAISGWLATALMAFLWWRGRPGDGPTENTMIEQRVRPLISAIKAATKKSDPVSARTLILQWASLHYAVRCRTLDDVRAVASPRLSQELKALDAVLFSPGDDSWNGESLFAAISEEAAPSNTGEATVSTLYPTR